MREDFSEADRFELKKNSVHALAIKMYDHFLLCDHRPFCHTQRFTPLIRKVS